MTPSPDDGEVRELSQSGIQFIATYVGSIPIKASLRDMRSTDLRLRVVKTAIHAVASKARADKDPEMAPIEEDSVAVLLVGEGQPLIKNVQVALNVSSKAISMSHADTKQPERNGGLVSRHQLSFISFAGAGDQPHQDLLGYIAKVKDDRRCHVVRLHDVRVSRVMMCVNKAMELNAAKTNQQMRPKEVPHASEPSTTRGGAEKKETGDENSEWSISREAFDSLSRQSWYHGLLTREDAERMLVYVGDFLVRQSSRIPGQVILSGRDGARVQHVLLMDENTGQVRTHDHQFQTVVDLVNYYYMHKQPIHSDDVLIELIRPIPRREIIPEA
uniref:Shc-1 n=1 Tax=Pristionchus pacificus TaxID=54126 RepID=A0A8R1UK29_PRIPA